jgi:hypothetical protein
MSENCSIAEQILRIDFVAWRTPLIMIWQSSLRDAKLGKKRFFVVTRGVTVPSPLVELELFKQFQFIWTRAVRRFSSTELELLAGSVQQNSSCSPAQLNRTRAVRQLSSTELELFVSSVHLNSNCSATQFNWTRTVGWFGSSERELMNTSTHRKWTVRTVRTCS